MRTRTLLTVALGCWLSFPFAVRAQAPPAKATEWTVEGEKREALVFAPTKKAEGPAPLVLDFHGHGGTMRNTARSGFPTLWPEAIVVCPQGLPTVTPNDPDGTRSGWQPRLGANKDRDLKFVDAMLKTLREKHAVDDRRVYSTGHSNGGGFTYLLWANRGKEFAAIAPSSAGIAGLRLAKDLKPLPILHLAGEADKIVPYENQQRTIAAVKQVNGCAAAGEPWAKAGKLVGTQYPSKAGTPLVTLVHPGTHKYPDEAPELIVKFFKEHAKK